MKRRSLIIALIIVLLSACHESETPDPQKTTANSQQVKDYIRPIPGKNDTISAADRQRGEVLIAYSDCYSCHTIDKRAKGPAFKDIAKRYPVNNGYIELLSQKIILGSTGAWGYAVMEPHPHIPKHQAGLMVKFILSLKE